MIVKGLRAATVAVLLSSDASAQSGGIFIQGGPLLDSLTTSSVDSVSTRVVSGSGVTYRWNDLNGDRRWQPGEEEELIPNLTTVETRTQSPRFAPGASASIGVFVTPSISLRVEGSFQGERVTTTESTPLTLFTPAGSRRSVTTADIFVAAGWHQGESRKVALTYLAGMVFRRQREETTLTPATLRQADEVSFGSTLYDAGIMAGVDVTFQLSSRTAIVPQLRLVTANNDLSIRPAVAMRWRP
jgi:hypothetical protein